MTGHHTQRDGSCVWRSLAWLMKLGSWKVLKKTAMRQLSGAKKEYIDYIKGCGVWADAPVIMAAAESTQRVIQIREYAGCTLRVTTWTPSKVSTTRPLVLIASEGHCEPLRDADVNQRMMTRRTKSTRSPEEIVKVKQVKYILSGACDRHEVLPVLSFGHTVLRCGISWALTMISWWMKIARWATWLNSSIGIWGTETSI